MQLMRNLKTNFDMIMALGSKVWYLHPERTVINLDEILIHLSNINRYNGAVKWELIRHSYLVYLLAQKYTTSPTILACALGHDFHEAYVGDIVTTLKKHINFKNIESLWEGYVLDALGLPVGDPDIYSIVKKADEEALVLESWYCCHPAAKFFSEKFDYQLPPSEEDQRRISICDNMTFEEFKKEIKGIVEEGAYDFLTNNKEDTWLYQQS